jgi:hypothetical protein
VITIKIQIQFAGGFNPNHQLVKGWRIYQMKANMPHKSLNIFGLSGSFFGVEIRRVLRR